METRKVTIFDSQSATKKEFQSAAETWGEFKREHGSEVNVSDKKLTIRETRTTIESDDSKLPDGDVIIFTFQKKSKFGAGNGVKRRLDEILDRLDHIVELLEDTDNIEKAEDLDEELAQLQAEAEAIRQSME